MIFDFWASSLLQTWSPLVPCLGVAGTPRELFQRRILGLMGVGTNRPVGPSDLGQSSFRFQYQTERGSLGQLKVKRKSAIPEPSGKESWFVAAIWQPVRIKYPLPAPHQRSSALAALSFRTRARILDCEPGKVWGEHRWTLLQKFKKFPSNVVHLLGSCGSGEHFPFFGIVPLRASFVSCFLPSFEKPCRSPAHRLLAPGSWLCVSRIHPFPQQFINLRSWAIVETEHQILARPLQTIQYAKGTARLRFKHAETKPDTTNRA